MCFDNPLQLLSSIAASISIMYKAKNISVRSCFILFPVIMKAMFTLTLTPFSPFLSSLSFLLRSRDLDLDLLLRLRSRDLLRLRSRLRERLLRSRLRDLIKYVIISNGKSIQWHSRYSHCIVLELKPGNSVSF